MFIVLTRWLAGIFLLGGAGRLLSLAVLGPAALVPARLGD